MTIAAGFVCSDGIVIGADTEYASSIAKVYRTKIWRSERGDCLIATAGNEVLMKEAAETILAKLDPERSREDVKLAFMETMQGLYVDHINHVVTDPEFCVQVLVAAQTSDGLVLFRQSHTAVTDEQHFACIGSGDAFGNYVGDKLFGRDEKDRPMISGCIAVAHLLNLAKTYVPGCGGTESEIYRLPAEGWAYQESDANISRLETYFTAVNAVLTPLMLAIPNPWVPDAGVEERLRVFCEGVRATRPFPFDLTVQLTGVGGASGLVGQPLTVLIAPTRPSNAPPSNATEAPQGQRDPTGESSDQPPSQE